MAAIAESSTFGEESQSVLPILLEHDVGIVGRQDPTLGKICCGTQHRRKVEARKRDGRGTGLVLRMLLGEGKTGFGGVRYG